MDLTASFLAGSILGWALPIGLLLVVAVWWTAILRRRSGGDA
jgi:cytochrome c-type biogenesis protein CcmH/NrfF